MPFIGQQPTTGAFLELDSLTASATADYTLQLNGANYEPESVNNLLVSINGVIQGSNTMSLSGSTLTVGATLSSSDVIDFVRVFGNVGTISTPTDGSVTANKIGNNAVDLTTKVTGVLPVANSQTNTPAFEATRATSDQSITDNTYVKLQYNSEVFDTDSKYDHSTNYRFTPTVSGKYYVYASATLSPQNQTDWNYGNIAIYKNGSEYRNAIFDARANKIFRPLMNISAVIDFNTTDYVEIYARVVSGDSGTSIMQEAQNNNIFGAYKLIGA